MDKLIKIKSRKKNEPKPICPLCSKSPTTLHWSDDWIYWHQVNWCMELKRLQTETNTANHEDHGNDDIHVEHTATCDELETNHLPPDEHTLFPLPFFNNTSMYNTRRQAALQNQENNEKRQEVLPATNVSATNSSLDIAEPDLAHENGLQQDSNPYPDNIVPMDLSLLEQCLMEKQNRKANDTSATDSSVHRQPACYAVQQFLSEHPLESQSAVNDLLKLIKYLNSPDMLLYTSQLPITREALWREVFQNVNENIVTHDESERDSVIYERDPDKILGLRVATIKLSDTYSIQFPYFDILAVLVDMIVHLEQESEGGKKIWSTKHTKSYYGDRQRDNVLYQDVNSGQWWEEVENEIRLMEPCNRNKQVVAILPYLDGVSVDFFDSVSMYPWVISLGNLTMDHRNKLDGKRLVAFIPNPSDEEIRYKAGITGDVTHLRRKIFDKCVEV